ncbi:MAG: penicillin-binding protein [Candidatus Symbiothrix sp.]|jgi:cell division protein FtsI (penicillin-binding protein 3)|nr:penicillin-binding protein [Candidatus Symbiothrix sp.]
MSAKKTQAQKIMTSYFILVVIVIGVALLVFSKAVRTSWKDGERWRELGATQVRDSVPIPTERGNIYACGGELLATNEDRYKLYIDFWAQKGTADSLKANLRKINAELQQNFPDSLARKIGDRLQKGLDWKVEQDKKIKNNPNFKPDRGYPLQGIVVDYAQWKTLRTLTFFKKGQYISGLKPQSLRRRVNPYGSLALRTIGSIYGSDTIGRKVGKNGLEMYYDSLLCGKPGLGQSRKVNGRTMVVPFEKPVPGCDIITTIDVHIQDIVEKNLKKKLQEIDAESGTAVLMETATGEVKAITNMGRICEGVWGETRNFAVSDLSEPGSTFKVVSMLVGLNDGTIHPDDPVDVGNGFAVVAGVPLEDHNAGRGYGLINAANSIRYSSNIGVAKLIMQAYSRDPDRYFDGVYRIGFHQDMHLEIPGYAVPRIRRTHNLVDLSRMSYGYYTAIPPIYTLSFFNAIANNGKLVKPLFVCEIRNGESGRVLERKKPIVINEQIASETALSEIRQMLDSVVNSLGGTGKPARSKLIRIAGKTGTAKLAEGGSYGNQHQVSFCGYFPSDKPKYSMIVVIRKPRIGNASGGFMCGAVFKAIAEEIYTRNIISESRPLPVDTLSKQPEVKKSLVALDSESNGIPNVRGMGAKDAVYAIERTGRRVKLSGKGTVVAQSVLPGNIVFLQLK